MLQNYEPAKRVRVDLDEDLNAPCCAHPNIRVDRHPASEAPLERTSCKRCGLAGAWVSRLTDDPAGARADAWRDALDAKTSSSRPSFLDASEVI